jgi:hypothetical protein
MAEVGVGEGEMWPGMMKAGVIGVSLTNFSGPPVSLD